MTDGIEEPVEMPVFGGTFLEFLVILLLLFGLFFGALIYSSTSGGDNSPGPTPGEHHGF